VPGNSQKYELECMRLAAECSQLATDVRNYAAEGRFLPDDAHNRGLVIHLLRMAKVWTVRAEEGPSDFLDLNVN
jgi:hypothetical protein